MNPAPEAVRSLLQWLVRHAGFPAGRLPPRAEGLLCVAALASAEEAAVQQKNFALHQRDSAQAAALRAHGLLRSRVHYKSDNSAKV
jgi:hypothetical protein